MDSVRAIAVKLHIENGTSDLPVNVSKIHARGKQWAISSYRDADEYLKKLDLIKYSHKHEGFAIKLSNGNYLIFYNQELSFSKRDEVIAHEIGHIVLGHTSVGMILGKAKDLIKESEQEREANAFATYLIAPTCILASAGISKQSLIEKTSMVSENTAATILLDVLKFNPKEITLDEAELCKQYRNFIKKQRIHKNKKNYPMLCWSCCSAFVQPHFSGLIIQ